MTNRQMNGWHDLPICDSSGCRQLSNCASHGWRDLPICDSHMHLDNESPVDLTVDTFRGLSRWFGTERIVLNALCEASRTSDPSDNLKTLYTKDILNKEGNVKAYAFLSRFHFHDGRDTREGYARQARQLYRLGADGFKVLDGKPKLRKRLGLRLDDPLFDGFWSFAEENALPVTMHLGDPAEFWDITKCSAYAVKVGWYCDETFPTLDDLRGEVEGILAKFPALKLTLAHFYFRSEDLDACASFFERHPNAAFDLTPGGEMYAGFSKRPDDWKAFFSTYRDRILFGTDTYNTPHGETDEDYERIAGHRYNLVRRMLETTEPFEDRDYGTLTPLGLPDDVLRPIYRDNLIARAGEPRPVNADAAAEYACHLTELFEHGFISTGDAERDLREIGYLNVMRNYFEK